MGGRYVISDSLRELSPRAHRIRKPASGPSSRQFMADTTSPSHNENSFSSSPHSRLFFPVIVKNALHLLPDYSGTLFPLLWKALGVSCPTVQALSSHCYGELKPYIRTNVYYPQDGYVQFLRNLPVVVIAPRNSPRCLKDRKVEHVTCCMNLRYQPALHLPRFRK